MKKSFICFGYDDEDGGILFARFFVNNGELFDDYEFFHITCNGDDETSLDLMEDLLDSQKIDKDARLLVIQNSSSFKEFYRFCENKIEEVLKPWKIISL